MPNGIMIQPTGARERTLVLEVDFFPIRLKSVEVQIAGWIPKERHRELFVRVVDFYYRRSSDRRCDYVGCWGGDEIDTVVNLTAGVSRANWIPFWRKRST